VAKSTRCVRVTSTSTEEVQKRSVYFVIWIQTSIPVYLSVMLAHRPSEHWAKNRLVYSYETALMSQ